MVKNIKVGNEGNKNMMKKRRRQVLFSGIITAIGMINFHQRVEKLESYFCLIIFPLLFNIF
jgi:ZIP family zinc transporter